MTAGRRLVDALAAVAARYGPGDRAEKLSLLDALERTLLGAAGPLLRFHEALCFLQAYPDAPEVLARGDRALAGSAPPAPARVRGPACATAACAAPRSPPRSAARCRPGWPAASVRTPRSPGPG